MIVSSPFSSVRLSGEDAKKFRNQVTYGKPKKAARESLKRGVALVRRLQRDGKLTFAALGPK